MSFQSFVWGTHKTPYLTLISAGCWLSHGQVLTRLFKLWEDVMLFAHSSDKLYDRIHKIQIACKVGILGWYFQHSIISAWHCKGSFTIFNVQDRIQVTRLRMELWCVAVWIAENLTDLLLWKLLLIFFRPFWRKWRWECSCTLQSTSARPHHSQSGKIFPRIGCKLQKSIMGQKSHIKQVSSQVSSREVDSLVDIDGTLTTLTREKGGTGFWLHIHPELPELAGSALKLLMPFPNPLQLWSWIFNTCWLWNQSSVTRLMLTDMRVKIPSA